MGRWMIYSFMAIILAMLLLAGCAGSIPGRSTQGLAGNSEWKLEFHENGQIKKVHIVDGKEKSNVRFSFDLQNGVASYEASDVKAFEAHEIRAILEARISSDVKQAFPELIDFLVPLYMAQ